MRSASAVGARVLHASLAVRDIGRSVAFYEQVFGASIALQASGMEELIQRTTGLPELTCDLVQLRFADQGALLELICFRDVPAGREDDAPVRTGHGHVCIGVTNFNTALGRARDCGALPLGEVVTYPDGRSVYLREPGGSVVELEEVET